MKCKAQVHVTVKCGGWMETCNGEIEIREGTYFDNHHDRILAIQVCSKCGASNANAYGGVAQTRQRHQA